MIPPRFEIVSFDANKIPIPVEKGKTGNFRVRIGNTPCHVAAKIINEKSWVDRLIGNFEKEFRCVELYIDNQPVLLNISSIAKCLDLQKDDIRKAAEAGDLKRLLEAGAKRKSTVKKVDSQAKATGILGKGKKPADRESIASNEVVSARKIKGEKGKAIELTFQDGTTKVFGDFVGKGSYGKVRRDGSGLVVKSARTRKDMEGLKEEAEKDMLNEHSKLNKIHAAAKKAGKSGIYGIQKPTRQLLQITPATKGKKVKYGYLTEEYQSDYMQYINNQNHHPNLDTYLTHVHQILFGLKYLAENGYLHGDLKPQNLLFKKTEDGLDLVHIADLGGVCHPEDDEANCLAIADRPLTAEYTYYPDYERQKELAKKGNKEKLIVSEQKRDVFAIGLILYHAFHKASPFPYDIEARTPMAASFLYFDPSLPKPLQDLIREMIHYDYTIRPTAAEAFERFEKFLKETNPLVYNNIQEQMNAY